MHDLEQEIHQPIYHRAAAVHEIERIQTEPARFAMAAHFRAGLALDPAAQQCNPGRVDPAEALGGQIKSFDERQPGAGTENAFKRGRADIVFQTVKPGRSRRFAQARLQLRSRIRREVPGNRGQKAFEEIMPRAADQPLHDFVRGNVD